MTRQLLVILFTVSVLGTGSPAMAETDRHLLSVLTADSTPTQAMALILTRHYVQGGGSAELLLCDTAAELALRNADTASTVLAPANASPRQMLGALLEAGVPVQVCAIFLPNREETEADLREGVTVARPDAIAATMRQPGTVLFSN